MSDVEFNRSLLISHCIVRRPRSGPVELVFVSFFLSVFDFVGFLTHWVLVFDPSDLLSFHLLHVSLPPCLVSLVQFAVIRLLVYLLILFDDLGFVLSVCPRTGFAVPFQFMDLIWSV